MQDQHLRPRHLESGHVMRFQTLDGIQRRVLMQENPRKTLRISKLVPSQPEKSMTPVTYHYSTSKQSLDWVHRLGDSQACCVSMLDVSSMWTLALARYLRSR